MNCSTILRRAPIARACASLSFLTLLAAQASAQMGHVMNGVGAVNQSMAGASTAAPIDPSGTLQWNPGALTALDCCTIQFSFEMFKPRIRLDSSVSSPGPMRGSSLSDSEVSTIPSMAFTYREKGSKWAFGLGAFGISGFGVNYGSSASNPILMAPPNGFGAVYSRFQLLQLSPTVAYQLDEHFSVGFAPTINQAQLAVTPACFASPDDANGDGNATYPNASAAADAWGYGAQLGILYQSGNGLNLGFSFKSPQEFENFVFNSTNEVGGYRRLEFEMDFPMIVSLGVGYTGFEGWTLAADLRYIDYGNTDGFEPAGFAADASVTGFGWDSILVLALGAQYELSDRCSVRAGYSYNENPISDRNSTFNVPAPAIIQHHLGLGFTWKLRKDVSFDVAYTHGFKNSISGQMGHPSMGFVPGSSVTSHMSTDSVLLGVRIDF